MADQAKWLKLWESALTDADLENLELDNWARWARLLLYIKCHGNKGKIRFPEPFRAIKNLFRMENIEVILPTLKLFPGCNVSMRKRNIEGQFMDPKNGLKCNDCETVTLEIEISNWHKYQVDSSIERVRKYRSIRNGSREDKKRKEKEESEQPFLSKEETPKWM